MGFYTVYRPQPHQTGRPMYDQEFKVSPIGFISPDEKDKSGSVFMEKTTEDVPQRTKEIGLYPVW
jgi:hypothetical protein